MHFSFNFRFVHSRDKIRRRDSRREKKKIYIFQSAAFTLALPRPAVIQTVRDRFTDVTISTGVLTSHRHGISGFFKNIIGVGDCRGNTAAAVARDDGEYRPSRFISEIDVIPLDARAENASRAARVAWRRDEMQPRI